MAFDAEPLPISALQHWLYCPRQCALIHVERLWAENAFTAEGRVLHERAHETGQEHRPRLRIARGIALWSVRLELTGKADVVEFHAPDASPLPIEYKRGQPKPHRADEVQLCAQGLCLEEMLETSVPEGALFYGQTRRRKAVRFDAELRRLTEETVTAVRAMVATALIPRPVYEKSKCEACSLLDHCRPQAIARRRNVEAWFRHALDRSFAASEG